MLLKIDFQSEIPIYLQLKNQIIEGIATGKIKPGEGLPSVRQLGADLGINLHTVNKAYNLLKQDGFIIIHRQKGVVVAGQPGAGINEDYLSRLRSELQPIITEAFCRGMTCGDFCAISTEIFRELKNKGGANQ